MAPTRPSCSTSTATCPRLPRTTSSDLSLSPSIKSLNYLNNIMARVEANQYGADEALMLDIHGYVSEATADNFFRSEPEPVDQVSELPEQHHGPRRGEPVWRRRGPHARHPRLRVRGYRGQLLPI